MSLIGEFGTVQELQKNSGIKTLIILYSVDYKYDVDLKNCYNHGFEEAVLGENGFHWSNLVSDSREVLFGSIRSDKSAEGVWTASAPRVFMGHDYVIHDVYCLKALKEFPNVQNVFGQDISKIREMF